MKKGGKRGFVLATSLLALIIISGLVTFIYFAENIKISGKIINDLSDSVPSIYTEQSSNSELQQDFFDNLPPLDDATIIELNSMRVQLIQEKESLATQNEELRNGISVSSEQMTSQQGKVSLLEMNINNILAKNNISLSVNSQLDMIDSMAPTWKANYNPILFKDENYKRQLLGLDISKLNESSSTSSIFSETSSSLFSSSETTSVLPAFFDWRNYSNLNYLTSVKNQGGCGSCWAFAAVGALEGEINAYYNNPALALDLSEQDLVSCGNSGSCAGGESGSALGYIRDTGIVKESCFDYDGIDTLCSSKCSNWQDDLVKISNYGNVELGDTEAIKRAIIEKGPLATGMAVYDDFFSYSSGIYQHIYGDLAGYHAIVMVGYGTYDGKTYWICKNSWSQSWGEGGYFKIFAGDSSIDTFFIHSIESPILKTTPEKLCRDNDLDSYCNWGLGTKPSNCPDSCLENSIEDCDDSNFAIYQGCSASIDKTGKLNLISSPSGAGVYVADINTGNYIYRGITPLQIDLITGQRNIKIVKEDYLDEIRTINVEEGITTDVNIALSLAPKLIYPYNNDIFRAGAAIEINGTIPGENFINYKIEYGAGEDPEVWSSTGITLINNGVTSITENVLGTWDTSNLNGFYTIKLTTYFNNSIVTEKYIKYIYLDSTLKSGWPQKINWYYENSVKLHTKTTSEFYTIPANSNFNLLKNFGIFNSEQNETLTIRGSDLETFEKEAGTFGGYYYGGGFLEPVVSDINLDTMKEIIVYTGGNPPEILVYNQDGTLSWSFNVGTWGLAGGNLHIPAVGDINNDGYDEIIAITSDWDSAWNTQESYLYVLNNSGGIVFQTTIPFTGNPKPIIADLNSDGDKEIIIRGNNAWNQQMMVLDKNGIILSNWSLPSTSWSGSIEGYPAIGNFDEDTDFEIVSVSPSEGAGQDILENGEIIGWNTTGVIYVYNADGSVVNGWPVYTDGIIFSSPVVGDINKDGNHEIIVGLMEGNGGIYVFNRSGGILDGWPIQKGYNFWSTPSLADINNDGFLEIVASRLGFWTYLINYNGAILNGWPKKTAWNDYYSSIIGDIDGDQSNEIMTTAGNGFLDSKGNFNYYSHGGVYAWKSNGNLISGFPKVTEADAQAPATISDIDNDGKLEIIASSDEDMDLINTIGKYRGQIYVWDLEGSNPVNLPWPTFMHDSSHTGCYDCENIKMLKAGLHIISILKTGEETSINISLTNNLRDLQNIEYNISYSKCDYSIKEYCSYDSMYSGTITSLKNGEKYINSITKSFSEQGEYTIKLEIKTEDSSIEPIIHYYPVQVKGPYSSFVSSMGYLGLLIVNKESKINISVSNEGILDDDANISLYYQEGYCSLEFDEENGISTNLEEVMTQGESSCNNLQLIGSVIKPVKVGTKIDEQFSFIPTEEGTYTLVLIANSTNNIGENNVVVTYSSARKEGSYLYGNIYYNTIYTNQNNNITANIYNDGIRKTENGKISLHYQEGYCNPLSVYSPCDNLVLISEKALDIEQGNEKEENFTWNPKEAGYYTLVLILNASNNLRENSFIRSYTDVKRPGPDVYGYFDWNSLNGFVRGEYKNISMNIINSGNQEAKNVKVQFYLMNYSKKGDVDYYLIGDSFLGNILADEKATTEIGFASDNKGYLDLFLNISADDDSDLSNNYDQTQIFILNNGTDLGVEYLNYYLAIVGRDTRVYAAIKNFGDKNIEKVNVSFYVENKIMDSKIIENLEFGSENYDYANFNFIPEKREDKTLKVVATILGEKDIDNSDNEMSEKVIIYDIANISIDVRDSSGAIPKRHLYSEQYPESVFLEVNQSPMNIYLLLNQYNQTPQFGLIKFSDQNSSQDIYTLVNGGYTVQLYYQLNISSDKTIVSEYYKKITQNNVDYHAVLVNKHSFDYVATEFGMFINGSELENLGISKGDIEGYSLFSCENFDLSSRSCLINWVEVKEQQEEVYKNEFNIWGRVDGKVEAFAFAESLQLDIEGLSGTKDLQNNITFDKKLHGKINFLNVLNMSRILKNESLIYENVLIKPRKISINTEKIPELKNIPAKVTFKNIDFNNPAILYNGNICPASVCSELVYNKDNRTLSVRVSGFSDFEVVEDTSQIDTPPINTTLDLIPDNGGCITDWTCSEWSECDNNTKTRICAKERSYCYAGKKPEETMECTTPEVEVKDPEPVIKIEPKKTTAGLSLLQIILIIIISLIILVTTAIIIILIIKHNKPKEQNNEREKVMMQAREFVFNVRSKGYSNEQIVKAFREKGWSEEDIKKIL
jgi:C1A family cysteine protease